VGLLVIFSATGLEAPVIALAAMGVPLLFQIYIYEVDLYEDGHVLLSAETLLIGAGLGVGWALLGGPVVSHALQPTFGATLGTWDVVEAAVLVPIVGQALMLVPLLLVLVLVPGFGGRRESLDGFTLGAASALGFSFAAVITDLASRLSAGLAPSRPFTNILTEALIRGIATPVLAAAATGLVGASIWVRKAEKGTVAAGGRWLADPLLVLGAVVAVQIGLGFADQARLSDVPLLVVHLAGTAVVLLALRVGLHHILLHERHDVAIGPGTTCSHCHHIVPLMPFCPSCGVALAATTKRHRPRPGTTGVGSPQPVGGALDEGGALAPGTGWPVLSPGAAPTAAWSGFPLAGAPSARVQRAHHTWLLTMFGAGLVAISVALVLTAVTKEPDTKPVPRCHLGGCPGLSGMAGAGLAGAGTPEPPPYGSLKSPDGLFSLGFFVPVVLGTPKLAEGPSKVALTFSPTAVQVGNRTVHLGGGTMEVADVSGSTLGGASAQQVVQDIVSADLPSGSLAYELPDALVGTVPGYGGVYDDDVNSSNGFQVDYRVAVMAAVQNGVAIVVMAYGPDDPSFQSLPFLSHPSFIDLDLAVGGGLDAIANSIRWTSPALRP
jgi:RsiW-degrading membrane proteinase PrsW (M82 family)